MSAHVFSNLVRLCSSTSLAVALCLFAFAPPITFANGSVGCSANELITAIENANANPGADVLELAANCTYTLTTVNNTDANLGPNGLPVIASDMTINGNGATITREANAPAFRLLQINAGNTLTLNQLTLTGGNSGTDDNARGRGGGAIYNLGTLNLDHTLLTANTTGSGSTISHVGYDGGNGGAIANAGTLYVTASAFQNNSTGGGGTELECGGWGGKGGGIFNSGTFELYDSTLSENITGKGGSSPLCTGDGGPGGAIANAGNLTIMRSTFVNNHTGDGGDRQTIGNSAGDGGSGAGIDNTGTALIVNATFTQNSTGHSGGLDFPNANTEYDPRFGFSGSGAGIANHATLTLVNVTLSENGVGTGFYLGQGSEIANLDGTTTLKNTIIANSLRGKNCGGAFVDGGGNVRFPKTDQTCVGTYGNPELGPLQDNGGTTQTMALAPYSRAINAGRNNTCPAADQRDIARPQGKICDSGAFELEPPQGLALTSPLDGTRVKPSDLELQWSAAERVTHYRLIVRQDAPDGTQVLSKKLTTTQFTPPFLQTGHWYYWRVKACSRVSCISTPWQSFRITKSESEF